MAKEQWSMSQEQESGTEIVPHLGITPLDSLLSLQTSFCHVSDHGGELDFRETKVVPADENAM